MKRLSILLLLTLPAMAYGGFRCSISSDVVWPQRSADQPDLSHRIEPNFNESEFNESLENKIIVTILIRKNGTVEDVIPARGQSDQIVLSRLCETLKKWKFHPSESEQSAVFSFTVKIETEEPTSRSYQFRYGSASTPLTQTHVHHKAPITPSSRGASRG